MKTLSKFFALLVVLAGTTVLAHAGTVTGSISFSGLATFNPSSNAATSITVGPPTFFYGGAPANSALGVFGSAANFTASVGSVSLTANSNTASGTLFDITNSNNIELKFVVTSYTYVPGTGGLNGSYIFTGTLSETGYDAVRATITFTPTGSCSGSGCSYSANISTTPEPSSLLLMGTGLMGAAGVMIARRRKSKVNPQVT